MKRIIKFFAKKIKLLVSPLSRFATGKPKRINTKKYEHLVLRIKQDSIKLIMSSSIVYKVEISNGGGVYFFRECEKHLPIKKYIREFTNFYFACFYNDKILAEEYKKRIFRSLENKNNLASFIKMAKKYSCNMFYEQGLLYNKNPKIVGIEGFDSPEDINRIRQFLQFALIKLSIYNENLYFRKNRLHTSSSSRIIAYKIVADKIRCGNLSAAAEYCFLKINDDKMIFGTLMPEIDGVFGYEFSKEKRRERFTPLFQKNLLNLNVLDYLCCMRDHTMYNYKIQVDDNGYFINACCFDNNESDAFSNESILSFAGFHNESRLIDENGYFNRPYIDYDVVKSIFMLDKKNLYKSLDSVLNKIQIEKVWERVEFLKSAIKKRADREEKFILHENKWNQATIEEELSGKYGKTYLTALIR